jgi:hypothetical protein
MAIAQVYLAGFAAEHLLTGRRARSLDVEVGLGVLAHLDPKLVATFDGIESSDGYGAVREVLRSGIQEVDEEIRRELERLYTVVMASLSAVWAAVECVATQLLAEEELDRRAVTRAIGPISLIRSRVRPI